MVRIVCCLNFCAVACESSSAFRSGCSGSWLMSFVFLAWCISAGYGQLNSNPYQPAEESFLKESLEEFERGHIEAAELSLTRFRALVGTRSIPPEALSPAIELGFRISIVKALAAARVQPPIQGLGDERFTKAWSDVEVQTAEWAGFQDSLIRQYLERKNESGVVHSAARIQHARLERARVLQVAHAFPEALVEIDAADAIVTTYAKLAANKTTVYSRSPKGVHTEEKSRGDAAGLLGSQEMLQRRMESLRSWLIDEPGNPQASDQLDQACRQFVEAYPGHPKSYSYLRRSMEIRKAIDVEKLHQILESTAEKNTEQFVSNQISLANLYFGEMRYTEARLLYEGALESDACPKSRLAEAHSQLGDIYRYQGDNDLAKKHYAVAQGLSDKFEHINSALKAMDETPPPAASKMPQSRTAQYWFLVAINALILLAVLPLLALCRISMSRKKGSR